MVEWTADQEETVRESVVFVREHLVELSFDAEYFLEHDLVEPGSRMQDLCVIISRLHPTEPESLAIDLIGAAAIRVIACDNSEEKPSE